MVVSAESASVIHTVNHIDHSRSKRYLKTKIFTENIKNDPKSRMCSKNVCYSVADRAVWTEFGRWKSRVCPRSSVLCDRDRRLEFVGHLSARLQFVLRENRKREKNAFLLNTRFFSRPPAGTVHPAARIIRTHTRTGKAYIYIYILWEQVWWSRGLLTKNERSRHSSSPSQNRKKKKKEKRGEKKGKKILEIRCSFRKKV